MSLRTLQLKLRGKAIWGDIAARDWPIYVNELWLDQVVLVGGYTGGLADRLLGANQGISLMHIYEPVDEFACATEHLLENEITIGRVALFREAVSSSNGPSVMVIADDWSTRQEVDRRIPISQLGRQVTSISIERVVERLETVSEYSVVMNCEGSEYEILGALLRTRRLPATLVFQSHTVGVDPYSSLYEIRALLSKTFVPVVTLDWAWDIWVRRDLSPLIAEEIERVAE